MTVNRYSQYSVLYIAYTYLCMGGKIPPMLSKAYCQISLYVKRMFGLVLLQFQLTAFKPRKLVFPIVISRAMLNPVINITGLGEIISLQHYF